LKILYCLFARTGDICCGIPTYLALREKYPNDELTWVTLKKHIPIVPKCGNVIAFGDGFGSLPPFHKEYDKVFFPQPSWHHRRWEKSKKHAIEFIADFCEVKLKSRSIEIETTREHKHSMLKKLPKLPERPFVTICSSPCYSCSNWPIPYRRQLVRLLRDRRVNVVTVGGKDGKDIPGAYSAHGKLNFLETIALINRSKVYIGPDTGTTWLACAAHKTSKVCLIDRGRLRTGVVGFGNVLSDDNITDSFYNDGIDKHLKLVMRAYK
jgi:ADP-heptose:LPS heptosyltransferase